jgi:phosphoserine phosphatase
MYVYFDMDATLVSVEGSDLLAKKYWVYDKVAAITRATMNGEIDFTQWFFEKMALLRPSKDDVLALWWVYTSFFTPWITNIINTYKEYATIGIISHGFRLALSSVQSALCIEAHNIHAVDLLFDDHGDYVWMQDWQVLLEDLWKWLLLRDLKEKNPHTPIIMIGDWHNDLKTQWIADHFIGFGINIIRPLVQAQAHHYVTSIQELDTLLTKLLKR